MKKIGALLFSTLVLNTALQAQDPTFAWAASTGGGLLYEPNGIAVDGAGNVYTIGYFEGTEDFDPGAGAFNMTAAGSKDIFISKLDAAGNFVWAKQMGGTSNDYAKSVALDGAGNVFITGYFGGTCDFDPSAATFNLTTAGSHDIFVAKLDASGNFSWAVRIGGTSTDLSRSIAVDNTGNVHITGIYSGTVDFDPGTGVVNLVPSGMTGDNEIFVCKLNASGNFVWAKSMGGPSDDTAYGIAVDGSGNVYTTGQFGSTADFDPSSATFNLTCAGMLDVYISKLDAAGNFVWAVKAGDVNYDCAYGIAVDGSGNAYATGYFEGTVDFDPSAGTTNLVSIGGIDVFVWKVDASGNLAWAKNMGGTAYEEGFAIAVDVLSNVYTTGYFEGTADFDPAATNADLTSAGTADVFISKLDASGNYIWAKNIGSTGYDNGYAITVNTTGGIYTTGFYSGTVDFDQGSGVFDLTALSSSDVFTHKMNQASMVGVNNNNAIDDVRVYPNPNNGLFFVEAQDANQIIVTNTMGEVVQTTQVKNQKAEICLTNQPNGIYLVQLNTATKNHVFKIIINK